MTHLTCDEVMHWATTTPPIGAHAMLCDPPYELNFMGNRWDKSGVAFRAETWVALARHLLPGAFVMAFASSRGYHRLACALEDAGLILHPSIFVWAYSSGWPKATKISSQGLAYADDAYVRPAGDSLTAPATPLVQTWAGHRYGRQMLKPSAEPILVAQVPYAGSAVTSITATGAGALWIDGARLATTEHASPTGQSNGWANTLYDQDDRAGMYQNFSGSGATSASGRWPTNLALIHTPTCVPVGTRQVRGTNIPGPGLRPIGYRASLHAQGHIQTYAAPDGTETVQAYRCSAECPVAALDAQAGYRDAGGQSHEPRTAPKTQDIYGAYARSGETSTYHDSGPASRFFFTADWALDVAEQLAHADPVRYVPKASQAERRAGLSGRNSHPAIKPLALLKWLATLLLPPAAYAPRRLLVPFCGTASEMIGGVLAGWEDVYGIEQDATYVALARQRLAWWTGYAPVVPDSPAREAPPNGQLSLF